MRSGRKADIRFCKRVALRTSQLSNAAPRHMSPGSRISIPRTKEPASKQYFARYPPIKPEAPVIKMFMTCHFVHVRSHPLRHLPAHFALSEIVPACQYPCTAQKKGTP